MHIATVIMIILAVFLFGIVIGACANVEGLNKRVEQIEADLYDDNTTEEDIKRIFDECKE